MRLSTPWRLGAFLAVAALALPAQAQTFSNTTFISVPNQPVTSGQASTYPSTVSVTTTGTITDLDVRVNSLLHTFPSDLGLLLVGPFGQNIVLMDGDGGGADVANVTLTFSDEAPNPLPSPLTTGTYRPRGGTPTVTPPSPAPVASGSTALSVFDGTTAAGTWRLYAYDTATGDYGTLVSGWDLLYTTSTTATVTTRSNASTLNVPALATAPGAGGPYPSTVSVSGVPTSVGDLNVQLNSLTHSFPSDVQVLLVGPGGQNIVLMASNGGGTDVGGVTLTFDDEVAPSLPSPLVTGTYKPRGGTVTTAFPTGSPAPPTPSGSAALTVFDGTNANGTWRLYVSDAATGDVGAFSGGWSLTITPAVETATVSFNPTTATVVEGGTATTSVVLTIADDTGAAGLNTAVSGTVVVPSANSADVSFVGTFEFPAGTASGTTAPLEITTVDDVAFEGNETVAFTFGTVTGGTGTGSFSLTITENDVRPAVSISEVDVDQTSTDTAEFVELISAPNTSLSGLAIGLVNGSTRTFYGAINLTGMTNAQGLYLLCLSSGNTITGCSQTSTLGLQNGGTEGDAVGLYIAPASSLTGSATTTNLVDAIVYNITNAPDPLLLTALGQSVLFVEGYNGTASPSSTTSSLARLGLATPSLLFYSQAPTPGAVNGATVTVDRTTNVAGAAGYRLFSAPVVKPNGTSRFNVDDLARINLVQAVAAGTDEGGTYAAQYPDAVTSPGPNLYLGYNGTTYDRALTTADDVNPGAGFFWRFYNQNITPDPTSFGGGTSRSYAYAPRDPGFSLALTGVPLENPAPTTPYAVTFTQHANGFYLIGNPFAYPFLLSGITPSTGTFQTTFQTFDGTSYQPRTAGGAPSATNTVAPWQGFFAESATLTGTGTFEVRYDSRSVVPTQATVDLVGRSALGADGVLALALDGQTAEGAATHDEAALVRFIDEAVVGWDRDDASKLAPLAGPYALLAPVGTRSESAYRQAVLSLPNDLTEALVPLAFTATHAGTYTITADLVGLPEGWTATLRDLTTGAVVDLADGHTFTSDATDWTDRFVLHVTTNGVVSNEVDAPTVFALAAPAPNPTSSVSTIAFDVPEASDVSVTVYDLLGRRVAVLAQGQRAAGRHTARIEAGTFAPGVYVVRMEAGSFSATRRVTVVR